MATASALSINDSKVGFINRFGAGRDLIDKEIDDIVNRANDVPIQGAFLFRKVTPSTLVYTASTVGNEMPQPRKQESSADLPYATPPSGFQKSLETEIFRLAMSVDRTVEVADRFGKIAFLTSGLMDSMKRKYEYLMADAGLNNAFATNIGADGMYLCDTDHPNEDTMTGTWDNLETAGVLTPGAFSTARVNMRKRTNSLGEIMPMKASTIVTGPDNEEVAWQINNSEYVADSSLRGSSWNKGVIDVMIYDYLTSTTAWFLVDKSRLDSNGGLVIAEKEAPTIRDNPSPKADIIHDSYIRANVAAAFWTCKEIQGNAGA